MSAKKSMIFGLCGVLTLFVFLFFLNVYLIPKDVHLEGLKDTSVGTSKIVGSHYVPLEPVFVHQSGVAEPTFSNTTWRQTALTALHAFYFVLLIYIYIQFVIQLERAHRIKQLRALRALKQLQKEGDK